MAVQQELAELGANAQKELGENIQTIAAELDDERCFPMRAPAMRPTDSATAIATGLCRTGRAAQHTERVGNVLRLARRGGGYYWISFDGAELRLGETLLDADPLQSAFTAAMARVGRAPK